MRQVKWIAIIGCLVMSVVACSSSGGGADLVPVTQDNAEDLARKAVLGKGEINLADIAAMVDGQGVEDDVLGSMDMDVSEMSTGTYTEYGPCDGSALIAVSSFSQSEASVSVTFDEFNYGMHNCEDGPVFDGQASLNADYNYSLLTETLDFYSADITFSNLSMVYGDDTFLFDGSAGYVNGGMGQHTVTLNMTVDDVSEGDETQLIGYVDQITMGSGMGNTVEVISGTIVDSQYGAVTLSTETAVVTLDGDTYPSSGVLVITGAETENGPSSARIVFSGNGTYTVSCDEDGDGEYEWDSGEQAW